MTDEFGQSVLDQTHVLRGTWEFAGEEYALEVEDISGKDFNLIQEYTQIAVGVEAVGQDPENVDEEQIEQLNDKAENLDNFSWEGEDEDNDVITSIIDAKLVNPSVDIENTGHSKLQSLFQGMMRAWQESESVKTAKEQIPLDEGNGSQSPTVQKRH